MPPPQAGAPRKGNGPPDREKSMLALAGAAFALILILYAVPLIKLLLLTKIFGIHAKLGGGSLFPSTVISAGESLPFGTALFIALAQYISILLLIELFHLFIGLARGKAKTFLLFSQFTLTSFFVFSLVLFILAFVFGWQVNNDWTALFRTIGSGIEQKFATIFAVIFIIFAYLSYLLTRLRVHFADGDDSPKSGNPNEKTTK